MSFMTGPAPGETAGYVLSRGRLRVSGQEVRRVVVSWVSGPLVTLSRDGQFVTFGRDLTCGVIVDDPLLSRIAGEIRVAGLGVVISNLSRTHSLHVESQGGEARLPATHHAEIAEPGYFFRSGVVGVFISSWRTSGQRLTVEIGSTGGVDTERNASETGVRTALPLRLDSDTKEFLTALFLCRSKLIASHNGAPPRIPELARQLLVSTSSLHLLAAFDEGGAVRDRMTRRVHEHLKQLRNKLIGRGLVPAGSQLSPAALADALVDHDIVRRSHLALLDDAEWISRQEDRWWA